jgi:hypothetical protein
VIGFAKVTAMTPQASYATVWTTLWAVYLAVAGYNIQVLLKRGYAR